MSSTGASSNTSRGPRSGDHRHEARGRDAAVSDVDRAKRFYESLGGGRTLTSPRRRLPGRPADAPPLGVLDRIREGLTTAEPGSVQRLMLAVDDIDEAREDLISRGIEVSEVFHLDGGPVPGPDPQGRSYQTYASFSDPDGNGWPLQEIKTRLPGREWED